MCTTNLPAITVADNPNQSNSYDYSTVADAEMPNLSICDGALRVCGDSMYPILMNGDFILYKTLKNKYKIPFFGCIYLLSLDMDGENYTVIGRIYESETPNHYKLINDNPRFGTKDIPVCSIKTIAIIKGSVRGNIMA